MRSSALILCFTLSLGLIAALLISDSPSTLEGHSLELAPVSSAGAVDEAEFPTNSSEASLASRAALQSEGGTATFSLPVGSTLEHSFLAQVTQRIESASGDRAAETKYQMTGGMSTQLIAADDDELIVSVTWPTVEVQASVDETLVEDGFIGDLRVAMQGGVLLRMRRDGEPLGLSFTRDTRPEARMMMRSVLAAMCVIVPEDALELESWVTTELDADGSFEAEYSLAPESNVISDITKMFLSRSELGASEKVEREETGHGTASLREGWIEDLTWDGETLAVLPLADLLVRAGFHVSLNEAARGTCAVQVFDEVMLSREWTTVSAEEDFAEVSKNAVRDHRLRRLGDDTVDSLLRQIADLLAAGGQSSDELFALRNRLADLIELDPEALGELARRIHSGEISGELFEVVAGSLGAAGTAPAQNLMCELVSATSRPESERLSVIVSMFQLNEPLPEVVNTAAFLARGAGEGALMADTSLLLLGALGQSAAGEGLAGLLGEMGPEMMSAGRGEQWLESLGNLGAQVPVEKALPYLQDPSAYVRLSAVHALSGSNSPVALTELASVAMSEGEPAVRAAAVEALALHADEASMSALAQVLSSDPANGVREVAIMGLAERVDTDPAARALLEQVAASDPDPNLSQMAHLILKGGEYEV